MFTTSLLKPDRRVTSVSIARLLLLIVFPQKGITKVLYLLPVLLFVCLSLSGDPTFPHSNFENKKVNVMAGDIDIQANRQDIKSVRITHVASQKEYGQLLVLFRKAGINVTNNSKIKKKKDWLKEIKFQLSHPRGLNFKLRVTGFQSMEFQFFFDENDQIQHFTYRINDEEVYQQINPTTKGYKTYVCFDTGIVQEGETNDSIERFH